jgi:hypothetical protein
VVLVVADPPGQQGDCANVVEPHRTNEFFVDGQGFGLKPGSFLVLRISENNVEIGIPFQVDSNGSVSAFWSTDFCDYGTVFSATATGMSADSLSTPTKPGVPITSNTATGTATYGCGS